MPPTFVCDPAFACPHHWAAIMKQTPHLLARHAQCLREQILEAIPGVPEETSTSSIPHQRSIAFGRCLVLDEPIGPVDHGWLAPIACVGRIPRVPRHECVRTAINNIVNEIGMPVEIPLDIVRGLIEGRSTQEGESAERKSDCSVKCSLHCVLLWLDHRECHSGMLLNGEVEHILNGDFLPLTCISEVGEYRQIAASEVLDRRSLCARGEHTHVAVHYHCCLVVLKGGQQGIGPSHGTESSCRRSCDREVGQVLIQVPLSPLNCIISVHVAILPFPAQSAV